MTLAPLIRCVWITHMQWPLEKIKDAAAAMQSVAIAIAVFIGGFGAASAAPIARRVFDYWLLQQYPSAEDMAAVSKGQAGAPIGTPRKMADMPWPPPELVRP